MEPKSELARYAFGYSDKKPGKLFWAIHVGMVVYILAHAVSPAFAAQHCRQWCDANGSGRCDIYCD